MADITNFKRTEHYGVPTRELSEETVENIAEAVAEGIRISKNNPTGSITYKNTKDSGVKTIELSEETIENLVTATTLGINDAGGGAGGGAVDSVNGKVGTVVLTSDDIDYTSTQTIKESLDYLSQSVNLSTNMEVLSFADIDVTYDSLNDQLATEIPQLNVLVDGNDYLYKTTAPNIFEIKTTLMGQGGFGYCEVETQTILPEGVSISASIGRMIDGNYSQIVSFYFSGNGIDKTLKPINIMAGFIGQASNSPLYARIDHYSANETIKIKNAKVGVAFGGNTLEAKTDQVGVVNATNESISGTAGNQSQINSENKTAILDRYTKSETYTKTETNTLLNAKLSSTTADNTYYKKTGGLINGVDGLIVRGSKTPIVIAPEFEGAYKSYVVGVGTNSAGVESTTLEIYTDKDTNTLNIKATDPNSTNKILFSLHPTDAPTVTQNLEAPRTLAYVDQIGGSDIKRLIVENLSTSAIPETGTIQSNTINLVENKNEITGATLNNNVITLPIGKYSVQATLHLTKTGNVGKNVEIALFDTSNNIIRNSVRNASWGTDTIGKHSFDWIGTLDVTSPISFSVGILASDTGFAYLSDANRSALHLSINKIG